MFSYAEIKHSCPQDKKSQRVKFLISSGWKFDRTQKFFWVLMYSSCYRISLTTKIFQALFCSPNIFSAGSDVDLFCVFISSLTAPLSFKSWVWAKTGRVENYTVVRMFVGGLGLKGKRGPFICRKFIHCEVMHCKVHASKTREERGEGWILWGEGWTVQTHPFSVVLFSLPLCMCPCACVCGLSLSLFPLRHLPDF